MSLLRNKYESFVVMDKTEADDGYGGENTSLEGADNIQGAIVLDSSSQNRIANAMDSKGAYTLTVEKNIELDYHTVIKRVRDNKLFRITSNSDDKETPNSAGLNMRQYTAEEWRK